MCLLFVGLCCESANILRLNNVNDCVASTSIRKCLTLCFYLGHYNIQIGPDLYTTNECSKCPLGHLKYTNIDGKMFIYLSYDVASGSVITTCIKICKPLVVFRFSGNVIKWRF